MPTMSENQTCENCVHWYHTSPGRVLQSDGNGLCLWETPERLIEIDADDTCEHWKEPEEAKENE